MAGLGRKDFQAGAALSAADVDGYLMDQSVMVFANSTARSSAIATATEGMQTYLSDSNTVYSYDGSAWNSQVDSVNYATVLPNSRNLVINGAMDFWQRGTTSGSGGYQTADRWYENSNLSTTFSKETTIVPTGFTNSFKIAAATSAAGYITQAIETANVMPVVGKAVTLSAYLYASASTDVALRLWYSTSVDNPASGSWTLLQASTYTASTTWGRGSVTATVPSNARTLLVQVSAYANTANIIYATGIQLEQGSYPSTFNRAGGTLQGELAACQRYYWRAGGDSLYQPLGIGTAYSTTQAEIAVRFPVTMRSVPSSIDYSTLGLQQNAGSSLLSVTAVANLNGNAGGKDSMGLAITIGSASLTTGTAYNLKMNGSTSAYLGFNSEL